MVLSQRHAHFCITRRYIIRYRNMKSSIFHVKDKVSWAWFRGSCAFNFHKTASWLSWPSLGGPLGPLSRISRGTRNLWFPCEKQGFRSMAPRLLRANSQKSCSRLSAVHISAEQQEQSFALQIQNLCFSLQKMGFREHGSIALLGIIPKIVLSPQRGAYFCIAATDIIFM